MGRLLLDLGVTMRNECSEWAKVCGQPRQYNAASDYPLKKRMPLFSYKPNLVPPKRLSGPSLLFILLFLCILLCRFRFRFINQKNDLSATWWCVYGLWGMGSRSYQAGWNGCCKSRLVYRTQAWDAWITAGIPGDRETTSPLIT